MFAKYHRGRRRCRSVRLVHGAKHRPHMTFDPPERKAVITRKAGEPGDEARRCFDLADVMDEPVRSKIAVRNTNGGARSGSHVLRRPNSWLLASAFQFRLLASRRIRFPSPSSLLAPPPVRFTLFSSPAVCFTLLPSSFHALSLLHFSPLQPFAFRARSLAFRKSHITYVETSQRARALAI